MTLENVDIVHNKRLKIKHVAMPLYYAIALIGGGGLRPCSGAEALAQASEARRKWNIVTIPGEARLR